MQGVRFFIHIIGYEKAFDLFNRIDEISEEKEIPVSFVPIDEKNDLHEIAFYAHEDVETIESLVTEFLKKHAMLSLLQKEKILDIDWVKKSLEDLPSMRVKRFFIHGSHSSFNKESGDISLHIEAGLAFGTGHHATTLGCLEIIDSIFEAEKPQTALDLGTGSAILAIALAKLGCRKILATDNDPIAIKTAQENIEKNGVSHFIHTHCCVGFEDPIFTTRQKAFDIIVANILAQPLIALAEQMPKFLSDSGSLILSGILDTFSDSVILAYRAQDFRIVSMIKQEEWVTLHLKR